MAERQQGVLTLLQQVSKPILPQVSLRGPGGVSLVPTSQERNQILQNLNLRSLGIGIAPRGEPCSLFEWESMEEATNLAKLLTDQPSYEEFVRISATVHDVVNEEIYVFAVMYAVLHSSNLRNIQLPPIEEVLPYWYFPSSVVATADFQVKESESEEERIVVPYEFPHTDLDPEYRMAYFREDVSLNSHHWHWHLAYPFTWTPESLGGTRDRKGELFYYMHQQTVSRYDIDRLCNGLNRVRPLSDFREKLDLAYFPNLMATNSGRQYAARQANTIPTDTIDVSIDRVALWKSRILEAIHNRSVIDPNGKRIPLVDPRGIDMLGDLLEATAISINRAYYGDYHNFGHRLIARAHDPLGEYGGLRGVMAFSSTAMRDPIFYRWHRLIDDIFNEYKETLTPYSKPELEWSDVEVTAISVLGDKTKKLNFLQTFWQDREVLLSRGLDFGRANPVAVSFRHLNHEEFTYKIEVNNRSKNEQQAIVRIFLAPVSNELNSEFEFPEQRRFFIELEKYQVKLKPGPQVLERRSVDSNVTLPTVRGFEQLGRPVGDSAPTLVEAFCGCGWPHHLLLPMGRIEGLRFVLFAMCSNWELDKVDNLPEKRCGDAASYCGIRDQKYPDKRNMGYPFDRPVSAGATLDTFLTPNMKTREIIIRHTGEIVDAKGVFQPAPIF